MNDWAVFCVFIVALAAVVCGGIALVAVAIGIGDRLSRGTKLPPNCILSDEQKQHNAEVDADEEREDYIKPEHDWTKWADVTAKTDGHSTIHVQEHHCLNCGYREFRKQKIKY